MPLLHVGTLLAYRKGNGLAPTLRAGFVQDHPGLPKQRIRAALQGTDDGPDPPALNQPSLAARVPLAAVLAHDPRVLPGTTNRDQLAESLEMDWPDL